MSKTIRVSNSGLILAFFLISQLQPLPNLAAESVQTSLNAVPVIPEISAAEVSQITNLSGSLPVNTLQGSLLPAGPLSPAESLGGVPSLNAATINVTVETLPANTRLSQRSQGVFEWTVSSSFTSRLDDLMPGSVADDFEEGNLANVEFAALLSSLNEQFADFYDFVAFFPTQNALNSRLDFLDEAMENSGALAFGAALKNDIMGIGTHTNDPTVQALTQAFGPYFADEFSALMTEVNELGPQQGTGFFDQKAINSELPGDSFRNFVFLQEMGHRWGSFLSSGGDYQANPLGILGRDRAHWGPFFDAGISPMDGMDWKQNFTNTFELEHLYGMDLDDIIQYGQGLISAIPQNVVFNDFDLYAMGLLAKAQVQPSFMIQNPTRAGQALNEDNFQQLLQDPNWLLYNRTINGTKKAITIDDILAIEGPRDPLSTDSQKNFNIAFVIVKSSTSDSSANPVRGMVDSLAANVSSIWSNATKGLSTMTAGPTAGAFDLFTDRILEVFEGHKNPIDPGVLNNFQNQVEASETNEETLSDLQSVWNQLNSLYKTFQLLAKSPAVSGLIGNLSSKLSEIQTWINQFLGLYSSRLSDASEIADVAFHSEDLVADLVNQVSTGGILPVGFYAYLESLLDDYNTVTPAVLNSMIQTLLLTDQNFQIKFSEYQNYLNQNLEFLSSLIAAPSNFDVNVHSLLPNMPSPNVGVGYYASTSSKVKGAVTQQTQDGFDFSYDVSRTYKGFVTGEINFGNHPGSLPELFTLGIKGPNKGNAKVTFIDALENKAGFITSFNGVLQNYQFDLTGGNVPAGFDRTQVEKIQIQLDQKLMTTSSNYRNTLQIRTHGMDYAAIITPVSNPPGSGLTYTFLPNRPRLKIFAGNDLGAKPYGEITTWEQRGDDEGSFSYNVEDALDANVTARIDFEKQPGYLPEQFKIDLMAPAGSQLEVRIVDINGVFADFLVNFDDLNFCIFDLNGNSVPPWFDRSQIDYIDLKINGALAGVNKKGTVGFWTRGLIYHGFSQGDTLNSNLHTQLPNMPAIGFEGGKTDVFDDPGEIESFSQTSASYFKFRYDLNDPTSYVKSSIIFNNGPGVLPEDFVLGVKGPNDSKVLVRVVDENGNFVEFMLRLFGVFQTYTLELGAINEPSIGPYPFDRNNIAYIDFIVDNIPYNDDFYLDEDGEGTIEILTAGLKYP